MQNIVLTGTEAKLLAEIRDQVLSLQQGDVLKTLHCERAAAINACMTHLELVYESVEESNLLLGLFMAAFSECFSPCGGVDQLCSARFGLVGKGFRVSGGF